MDMGWPRLGRTAASRIGGPVSCTSGFAAKSVEGAGYYPVMLSQFGSKKYKLLPRLRYVASSVPSIFNPPTRKGPGDAEAVMAARSGPAKYQAARRGRAG